MRSPSYLQVVVTPTLDTNAYVTGDRLGAIHTLMGVVRSAEANGALGATLQSLTLIDDADQKAAIDLLFFNSSPTVASADNAAISITDAEMEKCIGRLNIAAADYATITAGGSGNAVATLRNLGMVLNPGPTSTAVYVVAVIRGSATYAASSLTFKYDLIQN